MAVKLKIASLMLHVHLTLLKYSITAGTAFVIYYGEQPCPSLYCVVP